MARTSAAERRRGESWSDDLHRRAPHRAGWFGPYFLDECLANASRFTIWLATGFAPGEARALSTESPDRARQVVLKTCHVGRERDSIVSLLDELSSVSRLCHPNIARVDDVGVLDSFFFVAMEHIRGRDLSQILGGRCLLSPRDDEISPPIGGEPRNLWPVRSVPVDMALRIAIEVCEALEQVHGTGRIHGEIAPWHVMVGFDGTVKLLNVGLTPVVSRLKPDGMAEGWSVFRYTSPERVLGRVVDLRTDLYSVGLLLFELLQGRPWIGGDSDSGLLGAVRAAPCPTPALLEAHGIPACARAVLARSLHPEPAERFGSAAEMARALRCALVLAGVSPCRETTARTMWRLFQRPFAPGPGARTSRPPHRSLP